MIGAAISKLTVWGLNASQLHDRFWAARGVQVVRIGERSEIVPHAELFLLTDARTLALFSLAPILDAITWTEPALTTLRLRDADREGYQERVVATEAGHFVRFRRVYAGSDQGAAMGGGGGGGVRVGVTREQELALAWQRADSHESGWRRLRKLVKPSDRVSFTTSAHIYDATETDETRAFLQELVRVWTRPDATIAGITSVGPGLWADTSAKVQPGPGVIGPLWIGAGRRIGGSTATAVGPAIVWDTTDSRVAQVGVKWLEIEPMEQQAARLVSSGASPGRDRAKRVFDVVFSLGAIAITLWIYPIIMLAIWIEDGRPFFFAHERETIGGRRFECIKFRSMRTNAEASRTQLQAQNRADGPQFYIPNDPRLTRVGKLLRDLQLDELPQFFNVLRGEMSVVGPRPSPFAENQYCPPWRDARLSVRPGLTGLWQVSRTRKVGADFQEWIKYDIEYVERRSLTLDLKIVWQTIVMILRKAAGRG